MFESKITSSKTPCTNFYLGDLEDFIDSNLAYLLDMGPIYSGYVIQDKLKDKVIITIRFSVNGLSFNWDDVKDYMIPFIYRLNNQYKIEEIRCFYDVLHSYNQQELISVDDLINDNLDALPKLNDFILNRMEIIIKKK